MKTDKETPNSQNGNINITGKYAAGRNITVNKYTNFRWLIAALFLLTFLTLGWIYKGEINIYLSSFKKFDVNDTQNLKVLLLPFKPIQDNLNIQTDYKHELLSSLGDKINKDSLAISILSINGIECPKTDKEAEAIAHEKNADLVIWGSYIETNDGPEKFRLRYNLIRDFELPYLSMKTSNQEGKLNYDVSKLRSGYLQNNLFYLMNWIEGISAFNQNNYKSALKNFTVLQKDSVLLRQYDFEPLHNLSHIFLTLGRENFAFPILAILEEKMIEAPEKFKDYERAALLGDIAHAHSLNGQKEKSIESFLRAVDIFDNSRESGKDFNEKKSSLYVSLGNEYTRMTLYDKAEECFLNSQKTDSILITDYDLNSEDLRDILNNKINYTFLKLSSGEFEIALNKLLLIEEEAKEKLVSNDVLWNAIYHNLGHCYYELGAYNKALEIQKKVLAIEAKIYDPLHYKLVSTYNNIATYYEKLDSLDQCVHYQKKAIDIAEYNTENKNTNSLATLYSNYALNLADINEFEKSIEYNQKSISIRESLSGEKINANLAMSYNSMSYTYRKMKDYDKAIVYHKKTIDASIKTFGKENIYTGIFYQKMAESYEGKKDYAIALKELNKAESIFSNSGLPREHPYWIKLTEQKEVCQTQINQTLTALGAK